MYRFDKEKLCLDLLKLCVVLNKDFHTTCSNSSSLTYLFTNIIKVFCIKMGRTGAKSSKQMLVM